jgi:hypothetical protein
MYAVAWKETEHNTSFIWMCETEEQALDLMVEWIKEELEDTEELDTFKERYNVSFGFLTKKEADDIIGFYWDFTGGDEGPGYLDIYYHKEINRKSLSFLARCPGKDQFNLLGENTKERKKDE